MAHAPAAVIDLSVATLPEVIEIPEDDSSDDEVQIINNLKTGPDSTSARFPSRKRKSPSNSLFAILEVFPDADEVQVQQMLAGCPDVAAVLQKMADTGYTKTDKKLKSTGAGLLHKNGSKYDFMDSSSFDASSEYYQQALEQLQSDFCWLRPKGAEMVLKKSKKHYAIAHDKLFKAIMGDEESQQLSNIQSCLFSRQIPPVPVRATVKAVCESTVRSNRSHHPAKVHVTDPILLDEIRYVKQKVGEWVEFQKSKLQRLENKKQAEREGTGLECSCCFDTYALMDMVACNEGHLFCLDCLTTYAETQIFSQGNLGIDKATKQPALELQCCHGDGCSAGFARASLSKALPSKVLQKYDEIQFQLSIDQAGLRDKMCQCPRCGYSADVPSTQRVFTCPIAECGFESCVECGEESHIPLRCNEVEKKRETKGRLAVEEAISAAKIRRCPACQKAFIKSDGCNKVCEMYGSPFCDCFFI